MTSKWRARVKVIGIGVLGLVVLVAGGFAGAVQLRYDRTFDGPEPALAASDDPAVIERGRYLVFGPAHCGACHAPAEMLDRWEFAEEPPLSGGFAYPLPFGVLHFPNITPDEETGIGRYTDGQLARLLRYGIKPNGRALIPIMEYQNMSDEDIVAILSYLRSRPPVRNPVPDHEFTFLGRVLGAFVMKPVGPTGTPPAASPTEAPTIERGEYLANRVAQCAGCHTRFNMMTMQPVGPRFGGGDEMREPFAPGLVFVPPNLTPDPGSGHIVDWTEDQFVERFRAGRLIERSPMMWEMFARISETDLRAIFRYLMSLEPAPGEVVPIVRRDDRGDRP